MKLFNEKSVTDLFIIADKKITEHLSYLSNDEVLEFDPNEFGTSITEKCKIDFEVEIDFEKGIIETKMEDITGQKNINPRARHLTAIVYYSFPITRNPGLLQYFPYKESSLRFFRNNLFEATIKGNNLIIPIPTNYANQNLPDNIIQAVKHAIVEKIEIIKNNLQILKSECDEYNEAIYERVVNAINMEKVRIRKENDLKEKLNPFK